VRTRFGVSFAAEAVIEAEGIRAPVAEVERVERRTSPPPPARIESLGNGVLLANDTDRWH
jgi:hypothetical protein